MATWRAWDPDAERAQQAVAQRRLPADGDPAGLRRALEAQRRTTVQLRRWLPLVLAFPAGGLLWLAAVDGATELWVATASVAAVAVGVPIVLGGRLRLVDALLDDLEDADRPPPSPPGPPPAPPLPPPSPR